MKKILKTSLFLLMLSSGAVARPPEVNWWLTKGNQTVLLQKQNPLTFSGTDSHAPVINVDSSKIYQRIDGFGYTLTGSSALVINQMSASAKTALLKELFGSDNNSIGVSYIRISVGASDLSPSVFSYDDVSGGGTDETLARFNLGPDQSTLVPLLQQILKINPQVKILASPWSAPAWMKDNNSTIGGTLQPRYYQLYADYLVKYLQAMSSAGIAIDALTPQNEPQAL